MSPYGQFYDDEPMPLDPGMGMDPGMDPGMMAPPPGPPPIDPDDPALHDCLHWLQQAANVLSDVMGAGGQQQYDDEDLSSPSSLPPERPDRDPFKPVNAPPGYDHVMGRGEHRTRAPGFDWRESQGIRDIMWPRPGEFPEAHEIRVGQQHHDTHFSQYDDEDLSSPSSLPTERPDRDPFRPVNAPPFRGVVGRGGHRGVDPGFDWRAAQGIRDIMWPRPGEFPEAHEIRVGQQHHDTHFSDDPQWGEPAHEDLLRKYPHLTPPPGGWTQPRPNSALVGDPGWTPPNRGNAGQSEYGFDEGGEFGPSSGEHMDQWGTHHAPYASWGDDPNWTANDHFRAADEAKRQGDHSRAFHHHLRGQTIDREGQMSDEFGRTFPPRMPDPSRQDYAPIGPDEDPNWYYPEHSTVEHGGFAQSHMPGMAPSSITGTRSGHGHFWTGHPDDQIHGHPGHSYPPEPHGSAGFYADPPYTDEFGRSYPPQMPGQVPAPPQMSWDELLSDDDNPNAALDRALFRQEREKQKREMRAGDHWSDYAYTPYAPNLNFHPNAFVSRGDEHRKRFGVPITGLGGVNPSRTKITQGLNPGARMTGTPRRSGTLTDEQGQALMDSIGRGFQYAWSAEDAQRWQESRNKKEWHEHKKQKALAERKKQAEKGRVRDVGLPGPMGQSRSEYAEFGHPWSYDDELDQLRAEDANARELNRLRAEDADARELNHLRAADAESRRRNPPGTQQDYGETDYCNYDCGGMLEQLAAIGQALQYGEMDYDFSHVPGSPAGDSGVTGYAYYGTDQPSDHADLSPEKARKILHDGTVHGHPLTDRQRRFFGAVSNG